MMRSQVSVLVSTTGPIAIAPALLTITSSRPNAATVSSTARRTSSSLATSPPIPTAGAPRAVSSPAAPAAESAWRASTATDAPSSAKRWAIACPIPRDASRDERDLALEPLHSAPAATKRSSRSSAGSSTERSAA